MTDAWLDTRGSARISSSWHFGAHSWVEQTDAHRPHVHAHTHDVQTGSSSTWLQVGKGRSCGKAPVGGAGGLPRQVRVILLELGTWMAISRVRTGPGRSRPRARVSPVQRPRETEAMAHLRSVNARENQAAGYGCPSDTLGYSSSLLRDVFPPTFLDLYALKLAFVLPSLIESQGKRNCALL